MKIVLQTSPDRPALLWQAEVARRLGEAGHLVWWDSVAGAPPWPEAVGLILELERLAYRRGGAGGGADRAPPFERAPLPDAAAPDLVVDLSGGSAAPGALRLLYDGSPDPAAAVSALLDRRLVPLEAVLGGRCVASGLPGNEEPALLSVGLDAVFSRAADLCCSAVARIAAAGPDGVRETAGIPTSRRIGVGHARGLGFSALSLARKARGVLLRRLQRPHAWRVGLRRRGAASILDLRGVSPDGFGWLPDDGARYFADPFLLEHERRTWLFVEEYPYATGKGVISACEILADGSFGPTRVVIDEPCHLSYPLVFVRDGAVWMIPESSAARELVLYRATEFPWRWRRERVLVAGAALADATPLWHEGRVWLFATETGLAGGSSSDALSLFHAPDLFGDFTPHPLNPVLIDAGAARPGGRIVARDEGLLRVAQDCRTGYGRAAVLARVDRLDPGGYRQTVVAEVHAPAAWAASGLHAIEVGERFEAIDILSASRPDER